MLIPTISYYASTFHEDPARGNGLTLEQAMEYNQWKRLRNRGEFHPDQRTNIKSVDQMHTASRGVHGNLRRAGERCIRCRVYNGSQNNILPVRGKEVI